MSLPDKELLKVIASVPGMVFVETGTYEGEGVAAALEAGFKEVHSIEAAPEFHQRCVRRFEAEIAAGHVSIHLGKSQDVLDPVIKSIAGPICYWLDAHFQGQPVGENCALDGETIALRNNRRHEMDCVLIDDIRLIADQRSWGGHRVNLETAIGKLMFLYPSHLMTLLDAHRKADVLALFPRRLARQIAERLA